MNISRIQIIGKLFFCIMLFYYTMHRPTGDTSLPQALSIVEPLGLAGCKHGVPLNRDASITVSTWQ